MGSGAAAHHGSDQPQPVDEGGTHAGQGRGVRLALLLVITALGGAASSGPLAVTASPASLGCEVSASTPIQQPTQAQLEAAGLGDGPLASDASRRDLVAAAFSDATSVTNPLFPIADLDSAILNGRVDGKVFHTETTLLPFTRVIEWTPGQCVRVLVSQYMAFLDGRLTETAIDLYAQSDDGSVWYLGEDVFDYSPSGLVTTTDGTWHAGTEGPVAMIMPAAPQVGDAHRPENIPGNVFEEVEVTQVDQIVEGPSGPISGALVATEIHQDGTLSDKVFAPGYGEFLSTDGPDLEALALASPADQLPGGVPAELSLISHGADRNFGSRLATAAQWHRAARHAADMLDAWVAFRAGDVPPRLVKPTRVALHEMVARIADRDRRRTYATSIDVAYASNDLQLRYRPVVDIDMARFELWARRAVLDARNESIGRVRSDVVTLEWIRDRVAHTMEPTTRTLVDTLVRDLGAAVVDGELGTAAIEARALREVVAGLL